MLANVPKLWEEGDGDQDVTFVKGKLEKVMRELMAMLVRGPELPSKPGRDLAEAAAVEDDASQEEDNPTSAKLDVLVQTGSSELGLRFPTQQAIFSGKRTRQRIQVQAYYV